MASNVTLREVIESDLPIFFIYQLDPAANRMAAFTHKDPSDWDAFMAHWTKILADSSIVKRTILFDGQVVGNIGGFQLEGKPNLTYWIGREHWGQGIATQALSAFLDLVEARPLYASAARDNFASIRVLEKCGFTITGYERGFANARGEEIEEAMLELR